MPKKEKKDRPEIRRFLDLIYSWQPNMSSKEFLNKMNEAWDLGQKSILRIYEESK